MVMESLEDSLRLRFGQMSGGTIKSEVRHRGGDEGIRFQCGSRRDS